MFRKEEHALVLDFLPAGKAGEARQEPTAQVVGDQYFTLLELVTKPGIRLNVMDRVYIGKGVRDQIERIKCRILYNQLTASSQQQVVEAVRHVVKTREADFVNFLNKAGPVNIRLHALELLPNIGKKNLEALLAEREKGLFQDFEDIRNRVPHLVHVEESFLQRILAELKGQEKYHLFVKIPPKEGDEGERYHHDQYGDRGRYGERERGGYGDRGYRGERRFDRPRY